MIGFTTRLRTWLLIAALSSLLVAIGFLLGGSYIYLFLGLAVVMNFFGYFFSSLTRLRSSRAELSRSRSRKHPTSTRISVS